jgi:ribulose-5-phosphate 4-epimerase/fuculose-1-phosphate aldolase
MFEPPAGRTLPEVCPVPELKMPMPPTFTSVEEERQHRKERLAAGFRSSRGSASTRASPATSPPGPRARGLLLGQPVRHALRHIRASDLILVNHQGDVVEGDRAVNGAAFAIHSQVHAARPDAVAAAHSHSVYGKAWSSLGRLLDPITQDSCSFYGDHGLFDDYTGVVVDIEEGKRIAHALGDNKAAILRNHGLLTVGHSVDEAVWWFITMERTCQAQLLAEAAGTPISIDPEMAELTSRQVGSHFAGWFSFQPLYDRIVREQPDLLG